MKRVRRIFCTAFHLLVFLSSGLLVNAQQTSIYNASGWQLKDFRTDSVFGAGVERVYRELLIGKKPVQIIVAVIDGGIDTAHEDLKGQIWVNDREIPNNGIDDDRNGYIDDIHGWNYLGNKQGDNITVESYESAREYYRLKNNQTHQIDTGYRNKVKKFFLKDSLQQAQSVLLLEQVIPQMQKADSILQINLHKDSVYARDVVAYQPTDSAFILVRKNTLAYFRKYGITQDMSLGRFIIEAQQYLESSKLKLKDFSRNPNALRLQIVGDDLNSLNDRGYGNNNVSAGYPSHGTHVSGIIAASRNNGVGIDGVDDRVFIMSLRAVPDGDERDKDIALAIRYAVDNGARIINMSFGKYFSPGKRWVDEAIKYAVQHDVLLIHSAGNEMRNLDSIAHFPNPNFMDHGVDSCCFITVGSSSGGPDSLILARSSNFGKKRVDLFAPGVKLNSTIPQNQYATYSGTSMAAPVVTGVAALIMEYYPSLSAAQVKYVLMNSVLKIPENEVKWAPTGKTIDFTELSVSGGIVNAYNAFLLAASLTGDRKK